MSATIDIKDIGPVEHVNIPIPEGGGVIVLRGRNGTGKSNTLEAVESLTTGKGKLNVRDGALRGEVSGYGATITVGRSTRRTGELEVLTLEGKLSVADLVDPGLKSDDAADAKRIKALASLTGADADPSYFHSLLGGKESFESIVSPSAIDGTDWVQMADRIKRDIEREARKEEDHAEYCDGKARGMVDADGDIPEVLLDPEGLQRQLIESVELHSRLVAQQRSSLDAMERQRKAKQRIEASTAGERLGAAELELRDSQDILLDRKHEFEVARDLYEGLRRQLVSAERDMNSARSAMELAEHDCVVSARTVDELREQTLEIDELQAIVNEPIPQVSEDAIRKAEEAVTQIKAQIEEAAVLRERIKKNDQARTIRQQAAQHRKRAAELRNAARSTDEILSALVAKSCELLRVEHGRLVLTTKRGTTYYAELSHGERWKLAIDVALSQLGGNGVIVIPQEAFEGLDSIARNTIAEHAKARGVVILTAECSDDEAIVAEEYSVAS